MNNPTLAESDLFIGTARAAIILGKHKKQVIRFAESGRLSVVARLDGPRGAYVLLRAEVEALARQLADEAAS